MSPISISRNKLSRVFCLSVMALGSLLASVACQPNHETTPNQLQPAVYVAPGGFRPADNRVFPRPQGGTIQAPRFDSTHVSCNVSGWGVYFDSASLEVVSQRRPLVPAQAVRAFERTLPGPGLFPSKAVEIRMPFPQPGNEDLYRIVIKAELTQVRDRGVGRAAVLRYTAHLRERVGGTSETIATAEGAHDFNGVRPGRANNMWLESLLTDRGYWRAGLIDDPWDLWFSGLKRELGRDPLGRDFYAQIRFRNRLVPTSIRVSCEAGIPGGFSIR